MSFIPVMAKLNFQHHYSRLPMSHDPSKIILICPFSALRNILIITNTEIKFFKDSLMDIKLK